MGSFRNSFTWVTGLFILVLYCNLLGDSVQCGIFCTGATAFDAFLV